MNKPAVADLLVRLSTDLTLRARFQADPGVVMDEACVDGEDRAILTSGNPEQLRGYLGGNDAPPGCCIMFTADNDA